MDDEERKRLAEEFRRVTGKTVQESAEKQLQQAQARWLLMWQVVCRRPGGKLE